MHHKMRRGWSTPYVGLKKCRSHLLLEVQKTSLPFWKTFTINNVSWLIKDHISLAPNVTTFLLSCPLSIIALYLSFSFFFVLVFPILQRVTRTKIIHHPFLGYFWETYEKCTRSRSVDRAHTHTRPVRVFFSFFYLFLLSFCFFFCKISHASAYLQLAKSIENHSIGVAAETRKNAAKRTTNKRKSKWRREKEGRKWENRFARARVFLWFVWFSFLFLSFFFLTRP